MQSLVLCHTSWWSIYELKCEFVHPKLGEALTFQLAHDENAWFQSCSDEVAFLMPQVLPYYNGYERQTDFSNTLVIFGQPKSRDIGLGRHASQDTKTQQAYIIKPTRIQRLKSILTSGTQDVFKTVKSGHRLEEFLSSELALHMRINERLIYSWMPHYESYVECYWYQRDQRTLRLIYNSRCQPGSYETGFRNDWLRGRQALEIIEKAKADLRQSSTA